MEKFSIRISNLGKQISINKDESIFNALIRNHIRIRTLCGGHGLCGKCKIKILEGETSEVTSVEKQFLKESELREGFRLACQTKPLSDLVIEIPKESLELRPKIIVKGIMRQFPLLPDISKVAIRPQIPKEEIGVSIIDLLNQSLDEMDLKAFIETAPAEVLNDIEERFLSKKDFTITISRSNRTIVDVEDVEKLNAVYGIALDIGTTTVVASIVDLANGKEVDVESMLNPQIAFGEDIISRISYVQKSESNLQKLQKEIIKGINQLVRKLLTRNNIDKRDVKDFVAVGNSVMMHLLLGVNPESLGKSPFLPVFRSKQRIPISDLKIVGWKHAKLYVPPLIAGYIGSDITAGIEAIGIHKHKDKVELLIDIGTNGEIILNNKGKLIATSFAAGAAFEGTKIKFGMRATDGAIEDVHIDPNTFDVKVEVIGNIKSVGICGTGIINGIAEMLKAGVIDKTGRFNLNIGTSRVRRGDDFPEFVIAYADETAIEKDITINQKDVRELQLAKAAVYASVKLLLKFAKLEPESFDSVYIAGGFGTKLRVDSIKRIKMLPAFPKEVIKFVGNTALAGAKIFLLSLDARKEVESVTKQIEYLNLGGNEEFYKELVNAIHFS